MESLDPFRLLLQIQISVHLCLRYREVQEFSFKMVKSLCIRNAVCRFISYQFLFTTFIFFVKQFIMLRIGLAFVHDSFQLSRIISVPTNHIIPTYILSGKFQQFLFLEFCHYSIFSTQVFLRQPGTYTNPVNIFHCSAFIIGFQTSLSVEQQNFCKAHNT